MFQTNWCVSCFESEVLVFTDVTFTEDKHKLGEEGEAKETTLERAVF